MEICIPKIQKEQPNNRIKTTTKIIITIENVTMQKKNQERERTEKRFDILCES